ncbi:MAG: hypothetical protein GY749_17005 [Desulfobacteraceae bacterium]|nr:hypothetical protein [Desulfobacteraceae bacterium]
MKHRYIVLALILVFNFTSAALCNEHHYWSNQFGSRSALMSGAVVGGVRDTSSGFYNPGAIGLVSESTFSVSANGYRLESIKIDDGAGTGEDIDSREKAVIPLLISGTLDFGGSSFGYSLIAKNQSSVRMSGRRVQISDILSSNPDYLDPVELDSGTAFDGDEEYRAQFSYDSDVKELWGGLSYARKVHARFSLGMSAFLAFRNQSYSLTQFARVTNLDTFYIASEDDFSNADFYNVRALAKFGAAADFGALRMGATLTTPSVSLYGKGTVGAGESRVKEDDVIGNLADDRQDGLDAEYKTPLSMAAGFEYAITRRTFIAGTIEWFAKQDSYNVITPESRSYFVGDEDIGSESDSQDILGVKDAADSVTNFAVALEHIFSDRIKGYLSFCTDYSSSQDEPDIKMGMNKWDIYHTTIGLTRKGESSELAVGLTYSFGSQDNYQQLSNLNPDDRTDDSFLLAEDKKTSADYTSLGVIVGYTYFFK